MAVTEAVENYLETILMLSRKQPDVHAVDICNHLGYSRPTLSVAIKQMKEEGLITVAVRTIFLLLKQDEWLLKRFMKDTASFLNY